MPETKRIGFLGTGIMGFHMARRLAQAGVEVAAWNRTADKAAPLVEYGVELADTPVSAVENADTAIVMVSDGPASDEIIFGAGSAGGILETMGEGTTILVMSSIPVATASRQGESCAQRKVAYLDAPVSGGEPGARDGKLTIMAGGDKKAFDDLQPVLDVMGRSTYVGAAGAGSLAKLANQVIVGNTIHTVAEALLLAQAGGADPEAVIEALKGGFADSPILQNHGSRMVAGNFEPGARSEIQLKDTRTAHELAKGYGLVLPLTERTMHSYEKLVEHGQGDLDHNAAWLEIRRLCGLD